MKYGITVCTLERWPIVNASEAEFCGLKAAKTSLLTVLGIEEKFDALLENYAEFERELLSLSLDHMVHCGGLNWSSIVGDAVRINRRLANLLTMTRLYADQVKHDIGRLPSSTLEAPADLFNAEYDAHFEYRLMDFLRNHVQHQGMPVGGVSYPSAWEDRRDERMAVMRLSIVPHLDVSQLLENKRLNPRLRAELADRKQISEIPILVRKYVESFSRVHHAVRDSLNGLVSDCRTTFLGAFSRSEVELGVRKHVDLISVDENGKRVEQIALVKDLIERIDVMKQRNPHLATLSRWFVSNEALESG